MIQITQIRLHTEHTESELKEKIRKALRLKPEQSFRYEIQRRSLDARKKPQLYYSYTVTVFLEEEAAILKRSKNSAAVLVEPAIYRFPNGGEESLSYRPVIVGSGPAGLFCAYMLALHGYRPVLLERGKDVEARREDVNRFWQTGRLSPQSNVQFGEGGAGTFSDGKLNTLVKDREGRSRKVLELFVKAGAPADILYESKPHIGTDVLVDVVKNLRLEIQRLGGEVRFQAQVTDILLTQNKVRGVKINGTESLSCDILILAIGHSARDTFAMLEERGVPMEAKEFAVGFRVEHNQSEIDRAQYGRAERNGLPAAAYKLTARASDGRGVYSFCMCPGGYVVNASSEEGRLAINGMSYHDRAGRHANSAIVVTVKKEDFPEEGPLAGVAFQRKLEESAFQAGDGCIPVQRYGDLKQALGIMGDGAFRETIRTESAPCMKGSYAFCDISHILPEALTRAFVEGMEQFGRKIPGFADYDVPVSAVESRTSSPVRILRDASGMSETAGLYPCGEGAGYAGGIMSAAMDGLRTAEKIAARYAPFTTGGEEVG